MNLNDNTGARKPMNKPSWLNADGWRAFLGKYDGIPTCGACGEDDGTLLSVDHIKPRAAGGTHDTSNLQCLCLYCNSSKGARPDLYWSQHFYWDNSHHPQYFRASQGAYCYNQIIEHKEWFARPWSQIGGQIYLLAWVVGAGKTLAIPAIAYALNRVVHEGGTTASPRVDRILVLVKEKAIRDQVAQALATESVKFGIAPNAPRVLTVKTGSLLDTDSQLENFDVFVSCIQMLWTKDGKLRPDLRKVLRNFSLIVIDEPHFALDQAIGIVEAADSSLVFGLTGTPFDAGGDVLKKFTTLSVYGWHEANTNDSSMKYLSDEEPELPIFFDEIGIKDGVIQQSGETHKTQTTDVLGYDIAITPVKTVAEAVVKYVHELDAHFASKPTDPPARHRAETLLAEPPKADVIFPAHAMIRVESIKVGQVIRDMLNAQFEGNLSQYPREEGYYADLVCSDAEDADEKKIEGMPLTDEHPWMQFKTTGKKSLRIKEGPNKGRQQLFSRFLVVVGMAREGVNNPLCCVVGAACKIGSVVESVQRLIGRQLRAYMDAPEGHVPHAKLDTVKIISHVAFGNREMVRRGIAFVMDMAGALEGIQTIDQVIAGDGALLVNDGEVGPQVLTTADRVAVAQALGEAKLEGIDPAVVDICTVLGEQKGSKKTEQAEKWRETAIHEPWKAMQRLRHVSSLDEVPRVLRETPKHQPSTDDLVRYIKGRGPEMQKYMHRLGEEAVHELATMMYRDNAERYHIGKVVTGMSLEDIRQTVAATFRRSHAHQIVTEPSARALAKTEMHKLIATGVKMLLGVPRDDMASVGSEWDTPQSQMLLLRPEVRASLDGFVRHRMMRAGFMPALAKLFGVTPDA